MTKKLYFVLEVGDGTMGVFDTLSEANDFIRDELLPMVGLKFEDDWSDCFYIKKA